MCPNVSPAFRTPKPKRAEKFSTRRKAGRRPAAPSATKKKRLAARQAAQPERSERLRKIADQRNKDQPRHEPPKPPTHTPTGRAPKRRRPANRRPPEEQPPAESQPRPRREPPTATAQRRSRRRLKQKPIPIRRQPNGADKAIWGAGRRHTGQRGCVILIHDTKIRRKTLIIK